MSETIRIRGARTHNLKNVDIDIPRRKLTVITGVSGSGKSSLAFDTIYAEGQRRYAESIASYARRFMDMLDKPDIDSIEGLSPTMAIGQHTAAPGSRSTVGTITEINDYLRMLFSRAATPFCPTHQVPLVKSGIHNMVDTALALPEGTRIAILAPVEHAEDPTLDWLLMSLQSRGYMRVRLDGEMVLMDDISEAVRQSHLSDHKFEVVIDRLKISSNQKQRLAESFEAALKVSDSRVELLNLETLENQSFFHHYGCPICGQTVMELTPAMFSFNTPLGACPNCEGTGIVEDFDRNLLIKDANLSLAQGAVFGCSSRNMGVFIQIEQWAKQAGFDPYETPYVELSTEIQKGVLEGVPGAFQGVLNILHTQWNAAKNATQRAGMQSLRARMHCPMCHGSRHRPEVLSYYIGQGAEKRNMADVQSLPIDTAITCLEQTKFDAQRAPIAAPLLDEILRRMRLLQDVGLGYLTLARSAASLSGGEMQRIRLAGQMSSGLTGVTYVLDEPTIGLHARDTQKIIDIMKRLRDAGNTVIVVEHDPEVIAAADYLVDMGPGAGIKGGTVIAAGTPKQVAKVNESLTAQYMQRDRHIDLKADVSPTIDATYPKLALVGAHGRNLKNVTAHFPVGVLTVVTGVAGSGKSTLIMDTLAKALRRDLNHSDDVPLGYERIEGMDFFDKVVLIDQDPIGKGPRSNPATYTGLLTPIRELFASTPAAMERGYGVGRFSFNGQEGRCEACEGEGETKIEMGILPPVYVLCPTCLGKRFNRETLEVKYKNLSIADVLDLTVDQAAVFFENHPQLLRRLNILQEVGMGYMTLGQSAVTFSGGEAQRIKLSVELGRVSTGRTVYILDEPTTGLHFDDIQLLMQALRRLIQMGNTVIVIEHNLDVIAAADWVVDIGPEAGSLGGDLVFEGTPEAMANCEHSITGQFLKPYFMPKKNIKRRKKVSTEESIVSKPKSQH